MGIPTGAMEQQDHIVSVAGSITMLLTQREVVEFQLRDGFSAAEVKILDDVVAVLSRPVAGLGIGGRTGK